MTSPVETNPNLDPLLAALTAARHAKEEAEQRIRELLAYGREFVRPRPYTLAVLAEAAGMSISGVRIAYGQRDINAVRAQLEAHNHASFTSIPTVTGGSR
jgi:hypothetical protein